MGLWTPPPWAFGLHLQSNPETSNGRKIARMAPFGLKLWENVFQMIPNISLFDTQKKLTKFSTTVFVGKLANCLFRRSYGFLDVIGRCASKNDSRGFDFQPSTIFGRGVKVVQTIFDNDFQPKMTFTIFVLARRHMCPS